MLAVCARPGPHVCSLGVPFPFRCTPLALVAMLCPPLVLASRRCSLLLLAFSWRCGFWVPACGPPLFVFSCRSFFPGPVRSVLMSSIVLLQSPPAATPLTLGGRFAARWVVAVWLDPRWSYPTTLFRFFAGAFFFARRVILCGRLYRSRISTQGIVSCLAATRAR